MRTRGAILLGIGIGALFLWLAVRQTDFAAISRHLNEADWRYVPAIVGATALFFWLKTIRWRLLLSPVEVVPASRLLPVVVVGYASNILLPAQLGEFVRTFLASMQFRMSAAPVFVTIVLERIFDFLTILVFVAMVIPFTDEVPRELSVAGYLCGTIGIVMIALAMLHAHRPQVMGGLFTMISPWLPGRVRAPLRKQFDLATGGLSSLKDVRLFASIVVLSVAQWLCMGAATWLAIAAVGLPVPFTAAIVVLAIVIVGMTIPSSPGFFGTIQLCYTIGLSVFGVAAGPAVAASIVYHLVMFVSVAVAGLWFLRSIDYSAGFLYRKSSEAATELREAGYSSSGGSDD